MKALTALLVICPILFCGCRQSRVAETRFSSQKARIPLFDAVAATPQYSNSIAAADRDLQGDEWSTFPFRENRSRTQRVAPIAQRVLSEIKPQLKHMSVADLMLSLKLQDGSGFVTNYIADALYPEGNDLIISEIKSRSKAERELLLTWPRDGTYLDTGSNGESYTVYQLVQDLISHSLPGTTILERVLADPAYSNAVAEAERDQPSDNWAIHPHRHNVSRDKREIGIATRMLAQIEPEIARMTVAELIKSLKLVPHRTLATNVSGVAYFVYMNGNQRILSEIRARPKEELVVLRHFTNANVEVFEGAQGSGDTISQVIDDILGK